MRKTAIEDHLSDADLLSTSYFNVIDQSADGKSFLDRTVQNEETKLFHKFDGLRYIDEDII